MAVEVYSAATDAVAVYAVEGACARARADRLAVEEPLEIRTREACKTSARTLSLTMRTPSTNPHEDGDLALGFLFGEGLLRDPSEVVAVEQPQANAVVVVLREGTALAGRSSAQLQRHFYVTSACGICGKSAPETLAATPAAPLQPAQPEQRLNPLLLHGLPASLRAAQAAFSATGGLHAAGLFEIADAAAGPAHLRLAREDVGRHNAVDKLIGACFRAAKQPLSLYNAILCVSGRASFELVQKARMAGVPIFVAVGAPSSLAVRLAREAGMTLVGFARDGRYNVYSAPERLALRPPPPPPAG